MADADNHDDNCNDSYVPSNERVGDRDRAEAVTVHSRINLTSAQPRKKLPSGSKTKTKTDLGTMQTRPCKRTSTVRRKLHCILWSAVRD